MLYDDLIMSDKKSKHHFDEKVESRIDKLEADIKALHPRINYP